MLLTYDKIVVVAHACSDNLPVRYKATLLCAVFAVRKS